MNNIYITKIKNIIEKCSKENPCDLDIRYDEPMKKHTTFKVGGPADCWLRPYGKNFAQFTKKLMISCYAEEVPFFILGGGANIVVSDNGISGITLDTGGWKDIKAADEGVSFGSGVTMDEAANYAADEGLTGLEFLAGMPGSIGGAVYMNARCYGSEIADVLAWTEVIDSEIKKIPVNKNEFGYKLSPFQGKKNIILSACFNLKPDDKNEINNKMIQYRNDRKEKGHYLFPCAGSAFKNNRNFGKPTGQIIDELGLKSFSVGDAQIAPFHCNIVINTGNATAADIRNLMDEIIEIVKTKTGFILEPEIIFIGN